MSKFFEVTVEVVVATLKNGKDKKNKETYLVDAMSVTEAEARVGPEARAGTGAGARGSSEILYALWMCFM